MREYKNNQEPKVGDTVRFKSDEDKSLYRVTGVQGGRLGNKICVVPVEGERTFGREYYFYCFEVVEQGGGEWEQVPKRDTEWCENCGETAVPERGDYCPGCSEPD